LRIKAGVGFAPEAPCLFESLTPLEMGSLAGRFFASWDGRRYETLLARLGVEPRRWIKRLSKGAKMKCQLELLREEMEKEGRTVLVSSHVTSDLDKIADCFHVLREGLLALSGSCADLTDRPRLVRGDEAGASLLEAAVREGKLALLGLARPPRLHGPRGRQGSRGVRAREPGPPRGAPPRGPAPLRGEGGRRCSLCSLRT
jgi:ABC-type multidrug transport system ATPase subunit